MKIGILGYGRMGQLVEQIAHERGHSTIIQRVPADCDVCIDFSVAEAVQGHLEEALARSIPIVIGTTGWDSSHVPQLVRDAGGSCLVAPNFSTGIHQFHKIIAYACSVLGAEFDVALIDTHHAAKKDAPSGTAKSLAATIAEGRDHPPAVSSVRCGVIPGTHDVIFDGPYETITLTHTARSRAMWALGAVESAEWLLDKNGYFTLTDYLENKACLGTG